MEPAGRSSSSSEIITSTETDHQPEKSTDDTAGIGRSYECGFCKRGFTNAQALGGHMNIHRKDKAKAKQKTNPDDKMLRYSPQISSVDRRQDQTTRFYYSGGQVNSQIYLPSPNPNSQIGIVDHSLPVWRAEVAADPNLSLRIGQSEQSDEDGERNVKENEVDLELRLGYDP